MTHYSVTNTAPPRLNQGMSNQSATGHAERMPESDRAAVDVESVGIDAEPVDNRHVAVGVAYAEVATMEPSALQRLSSIGGRFTISGHDIGPAHGDFADRPIRDFAPACVEDGKLDPVKHAADGAAAADAALLVELDPRQCDESGRFGESVASQEDSVGSGCTLDSPQQFGGNGRAAGHDAVQAGEAEAFVLRLIEKPLEHGRDGGEEGATVTPDRLSSAGRIEARQQHHGRAKVQQRVDTLIQPERIIERKRAQDHAVVRQAEPGRRAIVIGGKVGGGQHDPLRLAGRRAGVKEHRNIVASNNRWLGNTRSRASGCSPVAAMFPSWLTNSKRVSDEARRSPVRSVRSVGTTRKDKSQLATAWAISSA